MGLPQDMGQTVPADVGSAKPYPARTKQVAVEVNGAKTDVTCISFSDKIMVTITQKGILAQWVGHGTVPLLESLMTFHRLPSLYSTTIQLAMTRCLGAI